MRINLLYKYIKFNLCTTPIAYINARALLDYEIIRSTVRHIINNLIQKNNLNPSQKKYIQHNNNKYDFKSCSKKILVDYFPVPQWIIVNSVLANELASQTDAELESFNFVERSNNYDAIYRSFGCNNHLRVLLNLKERAIARRMFITAINNIKTKYELIRYCIDDVNIGLDIYESILRNANVPTVQINHKQTYKHILWGIEYFLFSKRLFSSGNYTAVLLSHDNYISMGTVAKVAHRFDVDVYLGNIHEIIRPRYAHHLYQRFRMYPKIFNSLGNEQKKIARETAKGMLQRRINGEVGVRMSYQTKSAFTASLVARQTQESNKLKIVVATHCFFDNPHGYGGMLFPDFFEWLCFLGNLSKTTDYEWYLKVHRDFLDISYSTIHKICEMYPKFKILDTEVSWRQLKSEGVRVALTCYGSIGHELPLLGFTVVNAAYNPHISYGFNIHAESIADYERIIKNLDSMKIDIDLNEIYEFFYTHTELTQPDHNFFKSNGDFFANLSRSKTMDYTYDLYTNESVTFDRKLRSYLSALKPNKTFIYE